MYPRNFNYLIMIVNIRFIFVRIILQTSTLIKNPVLFSLFVGIPTSLLLKVCFFIYEMIDIHCHIMFNRSFSRNESQKHKMSHSDCKYTFNICPFSPKNLLCNQSNVMFALFLAFVGRLTSLSLQICSSYVRWLSDIHCHIMLNSPGSFFS